MLLRRKRVIERIPGLCILIYRHSQTELAKNMNLNISRHRMGLRALSRGKGNIRNRLKHSQFSCYQHFNT